LRAIFAIVAVDPDAGVQREAVEKGAVAAVAKLVGEPQPPVHLGGLEGGHRVGRRGSERAEGRRGPTAAPAPGGQDVPDEVVRPVLHPAGGAGGADRGLAREGHQPLETAVGTANSREAVCQNSTGEEGAQVAFHEGGQAAAVGAPVASGREERLEPLADDLMEERLLGLPPPVSAQGRARRASVALPGLGGVARGGHGRPRRKGRASSAAIAG
jgi:hypothetical protein